MSTGAIIRPVIEESTKTITITVPATEADSSPAVSGATTSQRTTVHQIPAVDRNAPYPTPAVIKALGFSNVQAYRDAHMLREYPQHQTIVASDDESEDTEYQVDLTNKIRRLASERTPGWN